MSVSPEVGALVRGARRIAKLIVQRRQSKPIDTTDELAGLIRPVAGGGNPQQTLARVFQALRLEVNRELENLPRALNAGLDLMNPGGRMVVISYHSLEDRIVKQMFRTLSAGCICPRDLPVCVCSSRPQVRILTSKPVMAKEDELAINQRSRSAKLRAVEKL